jgi:hypothetical protein
MFIDRKPTILVGYGDDCGSLTTKTAYLVQLRIVVNKINSRVTYDKYLMKIYG